MQATIDFIFYQNEAETVLNRLKAEKKVIFACFYAK